MSLFEKYPVLGIPVVATRYPEVMAKLEQWATSKDRAYGVTFADASNITRGRHESEFGSKLRKLDAVMPDGRPVLWGVNRHLAGDAKLTERVSGPDMFRRFQEYSNTRPHLKHYYLGGSDRLLADLVKTAREECPNISIVGSYSPPFREWTAEDLQLMRDQIAASGASVVWVGLGCPKQERWIADNLSTLPPAIYMGVGAAFAFYTGQVKRAPRWMQKSGIEWVHRLISEPRRLWKRYFVYNSLFIYYSLRDAICGSPSTS